MSHKDGLEEAKESAMEYLQLQLKMAERVSSLSDSDVQEFNNWFRVHPLFTTLPERFRELNELRKNKR